LIAFGELRRLRQRWVVLLIAFGELRRLRQRWVVLLIAFGELRRLRQRWAILLITFGELRRLRQRWAIPLIAFGESTIESKCLIFCWQFYHKRLMIVGMMKTMPDTIREYFATIGRKGGSKSRRTLTPEQARNMLRVREARRAFRKYHTQCFWYMAKDAQIKQSDIPEIVRGLKTNGGRQGFILAAKLCR
jgi:hypothetical protein